MNNERMNSKNAEGHKPIRWMLLSGFLMMLSVTMALGQSQTISGVVLSNTDNSPLPGASVLIKGTTTGTITDVEGRFKIQANPEDVILVSFIGYLSEEFVPGGKTEFTVSLVEDISELEEVVVVGYGVQQKKLVTGATVQVKGDEVAKLSTTSVLEGLQGQTPGVTITATSGQPGEGMKVNIRGVGTIGNSGPLYIVDGVQTDDISYLNSADIESVDVLKDAASAAIYGSQAANGVVLITTKSGNKDGITNISFDAYYGVQSAARKIDMLNSKEYAVIMNEAAINSGKTPYFTMDEINAMGEGTDWIDEMLYDNATTQNYVFGMNGGNDKSMYSMSLSYTGQEGIVGGPDLSEYNRYSFRINSDHNVMDDIIKVGQHLTFTYIDKNGISVGNQYNNTLRGAFNTSPFLPMYDDDGNYLNNTTDAGVMYNGEEWDPWYEGESNPYASMVYNNQGENKDKNLIGNIYIEINPLKNLKFTSRYGIDYYSGTSRAYKPEYELSIYAFSLYDQATQSSSENIAWTWDNFATYDFGFGNHSFSAMAGMTAYESKGSYLSITNADLTMSDLEHAYIDNTTNTDFTKLSFSGGPNDESMLLSYFGRLSYNYNEKYMFNATFRADGSSKFAEKNRWGYFPSVSAGWVLTEEPFMQSLPGWVEYVKLRASWGQVGNQSIDPWQYLAPISVGSANYYFGSSDYDASGNTVGAYQSRLANEDIKWEISEQTNFGVDANFLNGKLAVALDWYKKVTKDWLLEKPGYATDGTEPPFFNGGDVENTGIELGLNWQEDLGDFSYNVSVNISKNKNEVTSVPTEDGIVHGLENMLYDNAGEFYRRAESGYPIGYFWGWKTAGVFQNEDQIENYTNSEGVVIQEDASPGDLIYVDLNDDGVIDDDDKTDVGDPNPDYTYSLSFGCQYKGFDFSVLAYGVAGNQIVQSYRNHVNAYANYTTEILGRWHGEGTSNSTPRVTETNENYQFSDIFVQDGDFLRINNITLGYDFTGMINKNFIKKMRVYASVQNAFTFTKYNGMDPEVGYGLENGSAGVDIGYYPRPRTYLVGVNFNF